MKKKIAKAWLVLISLAVAVFFLIGVFRLIMILDIPLYQPVLLVAAVVVTWLAIREVDK